MSNKLQEMVADKKRKLLSDTLPSFENAISSLSLMGETLLYRYIGVLISKIQLNTQNNDYIIRFIIDDDLFYCVDDGEFEDEIVDYHRRLDQSVCDDVDPCRNSLKIKQIMPILHILEENGYIIKYDDEYHCLVVFVDTEADD